MEFSILELADISNAFTIAFPIICICISFCPIQFRSHDQSNCSSSYTPHSASSLFHHHSCCQTAILVKCNCLCSLYLWPNSSRWLGGAEPFCSARELSGSTTVPFTCSSPTFHTISSPTSTFLSSKTHWCLFFPLH